MKVIYLSISFYPEHLFDTN